MVSQTDALDWFASHIEYARLNNLRFAWASMPYARAAARLKRSGDLRRKVVGSPDWRLAQPGAQGTSQIVQMLFSSGVPCPDNVRKSKLAAIAFHLISQIPERDRQGVAQEVVDEVITYHTGRPSSYLVAEPLTPDKLENALYMMAAGFAQSQDPAMQARGTAFIDKCGQYAADQLNNNPGHISSPERLVDVDDFMNALSRTLHYITARQESWLNADGGPKKPGSNKFWNVLSHGNKAGFNVAAWRANHTMINDLKRRVDAFITRLNREGLKAKKQALQWLETELDNHKSRLRLANTHTTVLSELAPTHNGKMTFSFDSEEPFNEPWSAHCFQIIAPSGEDAIRLPSGMILPLASTFETFVKGQRACVDKIRPLDTMLAIYLNALNIHQSSDYPFVELEALSEKAFSTYRIQVKKYKDDAIDKIMEIFRFHCQKRLGFKKGKTEHDLRRYLSRLYERRDVDGQSEEQEGVHSLSLQAFRSQLASFFREPVPLKVLLDLFDRSMCYKNFLDAEKCFAASAEGAIAYRVSLFKDRAIYDHLSGLASKRMPQRPFEPQVDATTREYEGRIKRQCEAIQASEKRVVTEYNAICEQLRIIDPNVIKGDASTRHFVENMQAFLDPAYVNGQRYDYESRYVHKWMRRDLVPRGVDSSRLPDAPPPNGVDAGFHDYARSIYKRFPFGLNYGKLINVSAAKLTPRQTRESLANSLKNAQNELAGLMQPGTLLYLHQAHVNEHWWRWMFTRRSTVEKRAQADLKQLRLLKNRIDHLVTLSEDRSNPAAFVDEYFALTRPRRRKAYENKHKSPSSYIQSWLNACQSTSQLPGLVGQRLASYTAGLSQVVSDQPKRFANLRRSDLLPTTRRRATIRVQVPGDTSDNDSVSSATTADEALPVREERFNVVPSIDLVLLERKLNEGMRPSEGEQVSRFGGKLVAEKKRVPRDGRASSLKVCVIDKNDPRRYDGVPGNLTFAQELALWVDAPTLPLHFHGVFDDSLQGLCLELFIERTVKCLGEYIAERQSVLRKQKERSWLKRCFSREKYIDPKTTYRHLEHAQRDLLDKVLDAKSQPTKLACLRTLDAMLSSFDYERSLSGGDLKGMVRVIRRYVDRSMKSFVAWERATAGVSSSSTALQPDSPTAQVPAQTPFANATHFNGPAAPSPRAKPSPLMTRRRRSSTVTKRMMEERTGATCTQGPQLV